MAAMYHFELCRAILVDFRRQLKAGAVCGDGFVGMLEAGQEKTEVMPILPLLLVGLGDHILDVEVDGGVIYRDDLTGQILDPKLVRLAPVEGPGFLRVQTCVVAEGFRGVTSKAAMNCMATTAAGSGSPRNADCPGSFEMPRTPREGAGDGQTSCDCQLGECEQG